MEQHQAARDLISLFAINRDDDTTPETSAVTDGQAVFISIVGDLGYATLSLKPVTGTTLTITPIGKSEAEDAYSQIIEVENQANASDGTGSSRPEQLRLVEVEIFEAIE